ncbi:hypothetical protein AVEN_192494-1 [Araneus ventricosus]|uniref:Uncharacterized protein n=1 Tax=Araneus ventricosus TaxID=182803 RepID=A0A4Y2E642_ARAVE|nr:hypothetical protein AVEN_192494-1 [Araneus ventricosus]
MANSVLSCERDDLVVRTRFRCRRIPGSRSDSIEGPSFSGSGHVHSYLLNILSLVVQKFGERLLTQVLSSPSDLFKFTRSVSK